MNEMIKVSHLTYAYTQNSQPALDDVSFTISSGDWVAIVGHNGSGKSTLAQALDGLIDFKLGNIWVDGTKLTEQSVWTVRSNIGMIFQNPDNQFVGATVEDDVAFGLENMAVPHDEMQARVDEALSEVHMSEFRRKQPEQLSGGQKQRVALAGVIAMQPKIIILDEATSMLDPVGRREILGVIRKLKKRLGITVLSITHEIDETTDADKIIVLNDGKIVSTGAPETIYSHSGLLLKLGLDVPYSQRLKRELTQRHIKTPETYFDEEGMVDWLWQSLLKK
ncbi:cobalt transporter ATP-binding subunit [Pediococcus damnosus LMG 28219]|uniref:energy-coupling factor ABC transporter ATP-binding protein n=1 Tax=Pediococcus damnosus TaxID=51663 RepID=UPI00061E419B|nr:energy-coupling factor ABC transporter ATP-binding protein [Pediococcus damnosus]AMV61157.1 ATPase component of general energizing module of ECF transporter [Pediococcus damnosus]AMV65516.1 ATPase component of general energizing module of ECF transporter [Pediococcus damnosus]AMV68644.1 ATPase component of general energizing module of ECF transporter [Pediococcus damnosus]KJU74546.1 cobalt transporter ATP-binding subunit [Pediococcus damnosus LMG 28219]PIO80452.1 energy-coupling factor tran